MDINATLIGQMITFAIFVWFTMKFVWPMLEEVLNARQKKIADGLEAAERGHKELDISQKTAIKTIREAREQAEHTLDLARRQAKMIIESATTEGVHERERLIDMGKAEIEKMIRAASDQLEQKIINLTMVSTEKLLERSLTERDQKHLLEIARETVSGA